MRDSVDHVNEMEAAPAIAGPEAVVEAVHRVMHLYRTRQYEAAQGAAHGLTHLEGKVLAHFMRHPGSTQAELAAHSGRDKGQLARIVGTLRERELLAAEPDSADRRSLRLSPTAAGRRVHAALQRRASRVADAAAEGLSAAQRRDLLALLAHLERNLGTS